MYETTDGKALGVALAVVLLAAGCGKDTILSASPTAPTGADRTAERKPFSPAVATQLPIGQRLVAVVGDNPPECAQYPGWPCQYFDVTAPASGTLLVELHWDSTTQPTQGIDLSLLDSFGRETWVNFYNPPTASVEAPVQQGEQYRLTVWYTFPRLAFDIIATLRQ
jgi:hypothetical protein